MYIHYFPVEACPELGIPQNGSISTSLAIYGTHVTASCSHGFIFPDLNMSKEFVCEDSLQWNATIVNCTGRIPETCNCMIYQPFLRYHFTTTADPEGISRVSGPPTLNILKHIFIVASG